MPRGASSTRNPSDKATTEYFEAKYGALLIAINPATATPIRSAAASNSATAANGGGVVMHVTIKVDGAGGNAKQLAQEIKVELDKIAGVAERSAYQDGI